MGPITDGGALCPGQVRWLGSTLSGLGSTLSGLGSTLSGLGSTLSGLGSTLSGLGSILSGLGSTLSGLHTDPKTRPRGDCLNEIKISEKYRVNFRTTFQFMEMRFRAILGAIVCRSPFGGFLWVPLRLQGARRWLRFQRSVGGGG